MSKPEAREHEWETLTGQAAVKKLREMYGQHLVVEHDYADCQNCTTMEHSLFDKEKRADTAFMADFRSGLAEIWRRDAEA